MFARVSSTYCMSTPQPHRDSVGPRDELCRCTFTPVVSDHHHLSTRIDAPSITLVVRPMGCENPRVPWRGSPGSPHHRDGLDRRVCCTPRIHLSGSRNTLIRSPFAPRAPDRYRGRSCGSESGHAGIPGGSAGGSGRGASDGRVRPRGPGVARDDLGREIIDTALSLRAFVRPMPPELIVLHELAMPLIDQLSIGTACYIDIQPPALDSEAAFGQVLSRVAPCHRSPWDVP
jgi:hypothetical protein